MKLLLPLLFSLLLLSCDPGHYGNASIENNTGGEAMRITRSSMMRDSALMTWLSSALARMAMSSSCESGPGWMNSATFCRKLRLSSFSRKRAGWGSDTALKCRTCSSETRPVGYWIAAPVALRAVSDFFARSARGGFNVRRCAGRASAPENPKTAWLAV